MKEFFHGWRRKVGCVSLVMALALMGMWIRSRIVHDAVSFGSPGHQYAVFSLHGRVTWWSYTLAHYEIPYNQLSSRAFAATDFPQLSASIETTRSLLTAQNRLREASVPYWSLTIPMTLLSAYLMLWKPRKRVTTNA